MVPRGTAGGVQQSATAHTGGADLQSRAQRPHGAPPGRGARAVGGDVERACPDVARAHSGCSRLDVHALCSRLQVSTAGMGGRALLHITNGASRHHKSNARAILRAPRPATRVTRILPANTPLSENPTDTPQEQNGTTAGAGSRVYTCWRLCAPRNYNMVPYCVSWVVRWKKKGEKCHV